MTLHDEIANLPCDEVNLRIAKKRDEIVMAGVDVETARVSYPDYCHEWTHAGKLLDELIDHIDDTAMIYHFEFDDEYPAYALGFFHSSALQRGQTLTETIARFWLEWYEVNNAAKNEVKHE